MTFMLRLKTKEVFSLLSVCLRMIWPSKFLTQIRYWFLIPPRYKDSCLISSFVQSRSFLVRFFQKTQNYYWNWWNRGKMGDTDNSDFGSASFGKNCICHVIPDAIRVPKMYILSMLEISRVITISITLWDKIIIWKYAWF